MLIVCMRTDKLGAYEKLGMLLNERQCASSHSVDLELTGRMWWTTPWDVVDAMKCKHAGCGGRLFAVAANTRENCQLMKTQTILNAN